MRKRFNPFTGTFDFIGSSTSSSGDPNFSYKKIDIGETIIIPTNQEMVIKSDILVNGTLLVNGNIYQIP